MGLPLDPLDECIWEGEEREIMSELLTKMQSIGNVDGDTASRLRSDVCSPDEATLTGGASSSSSVKVADNEAASSAVDNVMQPAAMTADPEMADPGGQINRSVPRVSAADTGALDDLASGLRRFESKASGRSMTLYDV